MGRWAAEILARELDAVYFLTAGLGRDDVEYIMDSFTARRDSDISRFGEFRSKRLVLECYDNLAIDRASNLREVSAKEQQCRL